MKSLYKKLIMILLIILIFPGSVAYSATKQITIGTSSPSGAWMMLASTIAKLINDNFNDVNVTPVPSPRGSTENIETIVSGEREMGFAMANVAAAVAAGTAPFTRSEENINGWFAAHYGQWYLLAREDSGIKTFEDLKGKRIGIGLPGDGDESLNKDIFPLIGLKWDDFTPESCGLSEAIELVKQNQIDVISYVGAPRLPMFTELMSAKKMRLVALSPEQVEKISGEIPYLVQREMPQSDFPQLVMDTEKAPIFTMNHVMLCSKNIAEEDMYRYTKLFFENITTIHEANPAFAVITLENAVKGMPIKFHPGAEKYYKEKGVMQ